MSPDIKIRDIESPLDIAACHPVMLQLRPHMSDTDSFVRQVERQRADGYRLSAALLDARVIGLVGYRLTENLLHGRFVFVDDLVVDQGFRNDGTGARLLATARNYAREMDCRNFVLETGLHMALAQRFYFRQGLLTHAVGYVEILNERDDDVPHD